MQVSAKGSSRLSERVNVQVGNTATFNATLQIDRKNQVIEAQPGTEEVNTEQASIQGVLSRQQIEDFPVNGRPSTHRQWPVHAGRTSGHWRRAGIIARTRTRRCWTSLVERRWHVAALETPN